MSASKQFSLLNYQRLQKLGTLTIPSDCHFVAGFFSEYSLEINFFGLFILLSRWGNVKLSNKNYFNTNEVPGRFNYSSRGHFYLTK